MNDALPAATGKDIELGDVLLAMDVVDTLRHEQRVVSEALGTEARERALVERVRRAYAAQGIEVSGTLIAEGVAKLKEQQFDYEPPPPGFMTGLAKAWVNRRRIGTGLAAVGILAAIVGGGWYGFVEWPRARAQAALVAETDAGIADAVRDFDRLEARRRAITADVAAARDADTPAAAEAAVADALRNAGVALSDAEQALAQAATLEQPVRNANPNDAGLARARDQRLAEQRALLDRADRQLDLAARAVGSIERLRTLPGDIERLRDAARRAAETPDARARVDQEAASALSALARGDAASATRGADALRDTLALLQQALTVRIVSRPGVLSGVIRAPDDNPRASNYYLVVEALDASGNPVRLPVQSEEDGTTRRVAYWGVRVDEATFDRVRRDKADDGIIQADAAGAKPRGHVEIDWALPRAGGFIHTWENPR